MSLRGFTLFCLIFHYNIEIINAKTLQHMHDLYKNVSDDLMSIRKEFPATQPKVYSVLDRVDKMYNLAKTAVDKKNKYNDIFKNQSVETQKLYDEINTLKTKLASAEFELANVHKNLNDANKMIQEEKNQSIKLAQEKSKISKEQHDLQLEINKIKSEKEKKPASKDLLREMKDLKDLSEEEKALLNQAQSLSLSSTSAPNSPR